MAEPLPRSPGRLLAALARKRAGHFTGLWTLIIVAASFGVGAQYGIKLIVDAMADDSHSNVIWGWLALYIGLVAGESIFWRLSGWLGCNTVVAVGIDVRMRLFAYLSGHSTDYVTRNSSGALGGRITATAGAAGALVATLTWKIAPPCVDFIGAAIVLLTISPWMAATLSLFVVIVATIIVAFGRRGRPLHQEYATQNAKVTGELVDLVSNLWTVKAFAAREREYQRVGALIDREATAQRRSWLYLEKARVLHDLCLWIMAGTMMIWAIQKWLDGTGSAGDVVVVNALTFRILLGSRELALSLVEASQQVGVVREMLQVIAVPQNPADKPDAAEFEPGAGSIRFENVGFRYPEGTQVLEHFDLQVPAGQRLGIVGPSGSGKTTLLALIQRLHDVQSGRISIDDQDIREVRQDSLRAAIAVVPQDISLLHRTIEDNLRYGRPDASEEALHRASAGAHCKEFIAHLPQGYETIVGERGAWLSGGQRQRVGIARAMLKDAPILLMDEATSALDSASERKIQMALGRLMRGRTVVAVAHRLSTVAAFDRVIVMDRGRIVEDGPPSRLQRAGGMYQRLWVAQSAGQETA
ncbi:ABC transporter related protein [Burkholderiales bacterium 8X]|nr:ABC transporter related protein [Burkholderiales bacterium 8X]